MLFLPFLVLFSSFPPTTTSLNNETDFLSLLTIKSVLEDPLGSLSSWNQTTHFCNWTGIRCGRKHPDRVVGISLMSGGLVGSLSPHVGNLSFLRHIILENNTFHGPIPQEMSLLRRLEFVEFSNNSFTGAIPNNLSRSLVYPNLIYNKLSGSIPTELGSLFRLEDLGLGSNNLSGPIPPSIGNLTSLTKLSLWSCGLKGEIPATFSQLGRIYFLILGGNGLSGTIPSGLFNLSAIRIFEGPIPISIAKLSNLHLFIASENRFADDLPSSIGNLTSLLKLYLYENKFSGNLPPSIGNCTNLLLLDISHNNLNGLIPAEIMTISSLSIFLNLSNNLFEGSIPNEVGSLSNLAALDLSYNRLSGPIPVSLGACSSLQVLDMTSNLLEGEIPSTLSALTSLQNLSLSQNNLSGAIPTFLGMLDLQYLNLSFNRLQGEVPTTGIFKNKTSFSLDGNKELCGGISELNFPPCPRARSHKKSLSSLPKILIPVSAAGAIFLTIFAAFVYKKRMSRKNKTPTLSSFTGVQIMRLSYADILKATGGFSEANLLGFGRFGSVYKGVLDDGNTEIAVKVLNLSVRGASRSFMAECSAVRNVRHRNLLKILSVCESVDFQGNDFLALVYEFKPNGSLDKWLHQGEQNAEISNLTMMQRLNIVVDIAEGIEYLHSGTDSCIVHGDLKPSNILLDREMTASVGDFGLSKFISHIIPSHESNSSIGIRGTIGYVPPEYGMSCPMSVQGDAYSYGIVLLEIFTNKRPTDMSEDHVNLHCFVSAALPDQVMEVVDPQFQTHRDNDRIKDCLSSILSIGVSCSKEIPRDRMSMENVVNELHKIQKLLTRTR